MFSIVNFCLWFKIIISLTVVTSGNPMNALPTHKVAASSPMPYRAYPMRYAKQSMRQDFFLPKISAMELDTSPDKI